MEVRKEDFPVVVQAFETSGSTDIFIAEQIVNSQSEIDSFTSRYAGKLIKARKLTEAEVNRSHGATTAVHKKRNPVGTYILIVVILIIIALVVIGFTTGWFQQNVDL